MAAPLFVNVLPSSWLERGDTLRVTFAQEHSYLARDASFASDIAAVWSKLFNVGGLAYPITRPAATRGETIAVIDMRLTARTTVAELVNVMENISGFYVEVTRVEKLTATQAKAAPTNAGAQERENVRAETEKERDEGSIFGQVSRALGATVTAVKWAAVVAVVLLIVIYGGDIANTLTRRK